MRHQVCVLGIILSLGAGMAGAQAPKAAAKAAGSNVDTMPPELKALIDPDTAEVLKRINGLSPYETPDLRLRQDTVYANTPMDYEPFGAIKPYKEHFLKQMEYTGPGRAIPEPGMDLKSVKIGFIGPIMSTV